jgi:hypothetical protein
VKLRKKPRQSFLIGRMADPAVKPPRKKKISSTAFETNAEE